MCHLLLILPLAALPVFWIWPLSVALPVYGAASGIAVVTYWYAMRAMRLSKQNGPEALIGDTGHIVTDSLGQIRVQIRDELWEVASAVALRQGDRVKVIGAENTRLHVEKQDGAAGVGIRHGGIVHANR